MLSALKIAEFLWSAFCKKGLLNQGPRDLKITEAVLQSYEIWSFLWFILNRMGGRNVFCGVPQVKCRGGRGEQKLSL